MGLTIPCTVFGTVALGLTNKEQTGNKKLDALWLLPVEFCKAKTNKIL